VRGRLGEQTRRLRRVLLLVGALAAILVAGGSAADFDVDNGPCRETPGDPLLLRCPTAYVGKAYELEIESEEGSGCSPNYDYFVIVNSALPPGLSMTRDGVISGTPTTTGFTRFWIHNHDLSADQGGPSWCIRDDVSEREFSIYVDPGLEIVDDNVAPATVNQPYSDTLTVHRVDTLNPPTGPADQATWSIESGSLPPGVTLSAGGLLSGTPTSEGRYGFVVRAQNGSRFDTHEFALSVRQPLVVQSPFGPTLRPSAEVDLRFAKTATATGGSGTYSWSGSSGALPAGLTLDASKGTIAGTPTAVGTFRFGLTATDSEGRATTMNSALSVAPRLTIKTLRLKSARVGHAYLARLATAGGVRPVTWKLSGKLPPGISFTKSLGVLTGTPRRAGTYRLTVQSADALGAKAQKQLVLSVTQ
jgi:large repetitive protein